MGGLQFAGSLTRGAAIKAAAVLDASAAISWFFEDERDEDSMQMAQAVVDRGALVPPLFRWEIQNALLVAAQRKRISPDELAAHLADLDELGLQVDNDVIKAPYATGFGLAQRFKLTAYDAAYLELAVRASLPIMTRDQKVVRAATTLGILWKPGRRRRRP